VFVCTILSTLDGDNDEDEGIMATLLPFGVLSSIVVTVASSNAAAFLPGCRNADVAALVLVVAAVLVVDC